MIILHLNLHQLYKKLPQKPFPYTSITHLQAFCAPEFPLKSLSGYRRKDQSGRCLASQSDGKQSSVFVCFTEADRKKHIAIFSKGDACVLVLRPLNRCAESGEWEDGHAGSWIQRLSTFFQSDITISETKRSSRQQKANNKRL